MSFRRIELVSKLEANILTVSGYWYGGLTTGTGTSPATLPTGVSGTDPASKVPSKSAPYGNSTSSYYYPSGTAPYSTGSSKTTADPHTSSYGTVSGGPYKTSNSSSRADPTAGPTHGTDPPSSGTVGTAKSTGLASSKITPSGTVGTAKSSGLASSKLDPSGTVGTAKSSGLASSKLTYTAPTGIPTEYYYHHKKQKRNVSRFVVLS